MLRKVVRETFHQHHRLVTQPLLAKLRNPEFRVDVVVVEKESAARKEKERGRRNENQVGRVAGMNHVLHALFAEHLEQETRLVVKRTEVFLDVFNGTIRFRKRMAVYLDAIQFLVFLRICFCFRTDDRNFCTRLLQGKRFLPHTAVKRYRKIFDNNTDFFTSEFHDVITSRILHSSAEFPQWDPSGAQDPRSEFPDTCESGRVFRDS